MNWGRVAFGGAGAAATALGLALLAVPGIVAVGPVAWLLGAVETVGAESVLLAAGLGVLVSLGFALRTPSSTTPDAPTRRFDRAVEQPPGTVRAGANRIAAANLDEGIEAGIDRGGEPLAVLRERLRTTAASVYGEVTNTPPEQARAAVDRGEWCSDPVAAAFLSGSGGPTQPPIAKLRLLLFPPRERTRRIERTITAIEELEHA